MEFSKAEALSEVKGSAICTGVSWMIFTLDLLEKT